jgi:hypothetical protein
LSEQLRDDLEMPLEFRKILNMAKPEKQNLEFVIADAESSKSYIGQNEV